MIKKSIILLFLVISEVCFSQNAFEVASKLNEKDIDQLNTKIDKLLNSGLVGNNELIYLTNFKKFLNNPFSNDIDFKYLKPDKSIEQIKNTDLMADEDGDGILDSDDRCPGETGTSFNSGCPNESEESKKLNSIFNSIENITNNDDDNSEFSSISPLTSAIDATAKFLIDRTKKEISLTFFENFNTKLNNTISFSIKNGDKDIDVSLNLSEVFPSTHILLNSSNGLTIPSLGQTWLTAFKKDLNQLPFNLTETLKNLKSFSSSQIGEFSLALITIINNLNNGIHPSLIISELSNRNNISTTQTQKSINVLNLFSKNFTKTVVNEKKWITKNDFENLKDNKEFFLGWIYQEGKNSKIIEQINHTQEYTRFKNHYQLIIDNLNMMQKQLVNLKNIPDKKNPNYISEFTKLIDTSIDMFTKTIELTLIENSNNHKDYLSFLNKIKPVAKDIKAITSNISEKNYGESLLLSLSFLKHLTGIDNKNPLIKEISFYGNFLVDITNASELENDSSEQLTIILEKYALPVGSYRIKRRRKYSIDLAAYPGVTFGYEFSESKSQNFGITAPIGFSFSTKNHHSKTPSSSSSIFVSALDIGAPFTYRLTNDSAEGLPENISWEQIFSPGIHYVYGLKKSPFSVSAGFQYAPLLRKIELNNIIENRNILRFNISFVVDIPIFNLVKSKE
jgi:hypothetical protein